MVLGISQNGASVAITQLLGVNEACTDDQGALFVEHGCVCTCEHSRPFYRGIDGPVPNDGEEGSTFVLIGPRQRPGRLLVRLVTWTKREGPL